MSSWWFSDKKINININQDKKSYENYSYFRTLTYALGLIYVLNFLCSSMATPVLGNTLSFFGKKPPLKKEIKVSLPLPSGIYYAYLGSSVLHRDPPFMGLDIYFNQTRKLDRTFIFIIL